MSYRNFTSFCNLLNIVMSERAEKETPVRGKALQPDGHLSTSPVLCWSLLLRSSSCVVTCSHFLARPCPPVPFDLLSSRKKMCNLKTTFRGPFFWNALRAWIHWTRRPPRLLPCAFLVHTSKVHVTRKSVLFLIFCWKCIETQHGTLKTC